MLRLFTGEDLCPHLKCIIILDLYCHNQMKSLNYFVSDLVQQPQKKVDTTRVTKIDAIKKLHDVFHERTSYLKSFKFALEPSPSSECKIVIAADKRPSSEWCQCFSTPQCNEVAAMITEEFGKHDIVLQGHDK